MVVMMQEDTMCYLPCPPGRKWGRGSPGKLCIIIAVGGPGHRPEGTVAHEGNREGSRRLEGDWTAKG